MQKGAAPSALASAEDAPCGPSISLDTILNQEVYSLTSDIRNIMQSHRVSYTSQLPPRLTAGRGRSPSSRFSQFVVPYVSPVPCQGHVATLCEKMERLIPPLPISSGVASPAPLVTTSSLATPPSTPNQSSTAKPEPSASRSVGCSRSGKAAAVREAKPTRAEAPPAESGGEMYSPSQVAPDVPGARGQASCGASGSDSGLLAGSLIGQLKPEVFSSLVEIFKDVTKNTVKFYIYSGDEWEKSEVCQDIKVRSLLNQRRGADCCSQDALLVARPSVGGGAALGGLNSRLFPVCHKGVPEKSRQQRVQPAGLSREQQQFGQASHHHQERRHRRTRAQGNARGPLAHAVGRRRVNRGSRRKPAAWVSECRTRCSCRSRRWCP